MIPDVGSFSLPAIVRGFLTDRNKISKPTQRIGRNIPSVHFDKTNVMGMWDAGPESPVVTLGFDEIALRAGEVTSPFGGVDTRFQFPANDGSHITLQNFRSSPATWAGVTDVPLFIEMNRMEDCGSCHQPRRGADRYENAPKCWTW